jgi:hypothetical protein
MNKKVWLFKEVNPQTIRNRPDPSIKNRIESSWRRAARSIRKLMSRITSGMGITGPNRQESVNPGEAPLAANTLSSTC